MRYSPKNLRVFASPDAGSQRGRINIAWVLTVVGCFAALLYAAPAEAQATRTWVSGVGDDANPCSRTAPCKTFAGAISKTAPGGEINCLDPGGFGAVTITKSITISCEIGTAGVLVAGTNGIVVAAGPQDRVILRGLDINGVGGQGLSGIRQFWDRSEPTDERNFVGQRHSLSQPEHRYKDQPCRRGPGHYGGPCQHHPCGDERH
jgi:hypothetical protein